MISRSHAALWALIAILAVLVMQSMGGKLGAQLRAYPDAPLGSFAGQHGSASEPNVCRDGNFSNDPPSCSSRSQSRP